LLNVIWLMIVVGVAVGGMYGDVKAVTEGAMTSARLAVETVLGLIGVMALWLGMMKIAQESGFIDLIARALRPLVRLLFPGLPPDSPAVGTILMNMSANVLGLGSAATPLGLKAMQELQELNDDRETASDEMCTFLALNTSSVTLIPATVIALRASTGSMNPTEIVGSTIIATCASTVAALLADRALRGLGRGAR